MFPKNPALNCSANFTGAKVSIEGHEELVRAGAAAVLLVAEELSLLRRFATQFDEQDLFVN